MLMRFGELGVVPREYLLLEVSADLRDRQQQKLATLPPVLASRVRWVDALPADFAGAVVANEVLDVVPVHLVCFAFGKAVERGVALKNGAFVWQDVPALPQDVQAMVNDVMGEVFQHAPPEGYFTEFAPQVAALVRAVNDAVADGVVLWIDYGFRRAEFYHPSRDTGTLMCHYRHRAHTDPFYLPGLQDITAHVDFSAVADAGRESRAALVGYTSQAQFLLHAGITDLLAKHDPTDTAHYLKMTSQAHRLLSPAEMGEFFKVIGFAKGGRTIEALANARQLPL
jgi:SAM-dependent MidA family methyltransferase